MLHIRSSPYRPGTAAAALFAAAFTYGPVPACAQTAPAGNWNIDVFGTLGAVHSDMPAGGPRGPDSTGWAFDVDSRVGTQASLNIDKRWSAMVQVIAERKGKSNYRPQVEWANLKYQATPQFSVRIGRTILPLFLSAEYRKASYALPWVRPPAELYSVVPISNSDGIDLSYRWSKDELGNEIQFIGGRSSKRLSSQVKARATGVFGLTHKLRYGDLNFRTTVATARLCMEAGSRFLDAFDQYGPPPDTLPGGDGATRVKALTAVFDYDPGTWFLMGEVGRVDTGTLLGTRQGAYLSAGYRHGPYTPYLSFGVARADATAQQAARADGRLGAMLHGVPAQDTVGIGLRRDIGNNYALKLQYESVRPRWESLVAPLPGAPVMRAGRRFGVFSASFDFVY
jgi:hypothetical protein